MLRRLVIPLALLAAILTAATTAPAHRAVRPSVCANVDSARTLAAVCRR